MQVLGIIRWLKEWSVTRPGWVAKPQHAILPPAYLGEQVKETLDRDEEHNAQMHSLTHTSVFVLDAYYFL